MTIVQQQVPLQPIPRWGDPVNSILGSHFGTTDYLLASKKSIPSQELIPTYYSNEEVWSKIKRWSISPAMSIILNRFQIFDWFPRSPGLYFTQEAEWARSEAFQYLHPGFRDSPIRDHENTKDSKKRAPDYTLVFTPEGKSSMLQGGIGSIRLKPMNIFGEPHWLMTASSDGITHKGVPLALPRRLYSQLLSAINTYGAVCATINGEVEFVPDPFSRLFDRAVRVPKVLIRVTDIIQFEQPSIKLENSVAVSFVSDYQGPSQIYATYVTFRPDVEGSFAKAVSWMKTEYVEGAYKGRIITDFDQTQTVFPEARLALSRVMDRLISKGELRETIELMNASASVEAYFDEIAKQEILPKKAAEHRKKIFISYAHASEERTKWAKRIQIHLEGLTNSTDFEVWADNKIEPGQRWREQIEQAINNSRVAILVITADYLKSKFVRETELPLLLEAADADGARVFCIYGSDVNFSGNTKRLLRYQFVNDFKRPLLSLSEAEQETVFKELSIAVENALENIK